MNLFIIVFIFGTIIGSFMNVCIYRIPRGISIATPRSRCPHCHSTIKWTSNIPILSYILLRGRCSTCNSRISPKYLSVEILTGLLFVAVFYYFGFQWSTGVYWIFVSALLVITFIDLDYQIIPDIISLPGIFIGFLCSFMVPSLSWVDSLLGVLLGGGSLFLIAVIYSSITGKEGMGGGDIKLLAMIGAFLGWKAVLPVIFLSSFTGTLVGIPIMLIRKANGKFAIPFGPFLALGSLIYLLWGRLLLAWYLSLF